MGAGGASSALARLRALRRLLRAFLGPPTKGFPGHASLTRDLVPGQTSCASLSENAWTFTLELLEGSTEVAKTVDSPSAQNARAHLGRGGGLIEG